MRPLRLAFNHTRLARIGGVEGYIHDLVRYLLDRGHSIDFFGGKIDPEASHPLLRVVRVPYVRTPRPLRVLGFAAMSHRAIAREERRRSYDVVQGFSRTWYHTLYRDGAGCRQDFCELYLDRLVRGGVRRLYYRLNPVDALVRSIERKRYVTRPQRLVIAISRFVRDQILRRYPVRPETIRVIYSGVDCERFHPRRRDAGRATVRELLPPADPSARRHRHLAFVGNDYHRKGLDTILEALAALARDRRPGDPDASLIVAGGDPRAAWYERKAEALGLSSRARFLGKRTDVADLLAGSDLLLLPTWFDAFSNVTSEALASGTPVVASLSSGAAELIRPTHGWVLERNDVEHLGRAVAEFLSIEDLGPMREASRRSALDLGWDRHYRDIEAIYAELIERPAPAGRAGA